MHVHHQKRVYAADLVSAFSASVRYSFSFDRAPSMYRAQIVGGRRQKASVEIVGDDEWQCSQRVLDALKPYVLQRWTNMRLFHAPYVIQDAWRDKQSRVRAKNAAALAERQTAHALVVQCAVRGWFVRRCMQPPPGYNVRDFYVRRVSGRGPIDLVFCNKRTGFPSCAYPVIPSETGARPRPRGDDPPVDGLMASLTTLAESDAPREHPGGQGAPPFNTKASNARKAAARSQAIARASAEAPRRGAARAGRLGPITVFWRRGERESQLVRSEDRAGGAALDAYHAERDAHLARTELDGFLADEPDGGGASDAASGSNNYTNTAAAFSDDSSDSDGGFLSEGSSAGECDVDDDFGGSHAGAP